MDAVVTGVESFGIFVQGLELPAEGLVHVDSLREDNYRFDRANHTLAGRRQGNSYRLGDKLRVVVARVDMERRELDFRLVERKKSAKAVKGAKEKEVKKNQRAKPSKKSDKNKAKHNRRKR
ncbi:MAG: S1 RNA-binding domain-containing protein [Thermoguttaceae bacterium]